MVASQRRTSSLLTDDRPTLITNCRAVFAARPPTSRTKTRSMERSNRIFETEAAKRSRAVSTRLRRRLRQTCRDGADRIRPEEETQ